jgi:hypothetical protein
MRFGTRKLGSTLWMTLVMLCSAELASAEGFRLRASLDSTFHETAVDTNDDGEGAFFVVSAGRSNAGPVTQEGWVEFFPFDGVTFCGPTHVQVTYRYADGVFRFKDGSRLFTTFASGALCFNFADGTAQAQGTVRVIGGSGRFEGATGELAFELTSFTFPSGFGGLSITWEGTVLRP